MPCKIQIKENVEKLVDKYSQRGLSMSLQDANILASNVNTKMKHNVVRFFNDGGKVGRKINIPNELVSKYFDIEVKRRTPTVGGTNSELETTLVNGFLKDFNISVEKYNNLKEELGIDAYTASDLVTKVIAYQEGESILPEVAFFAYRMLGYDNNKLRSDLRYLISKWDKYAERFQYHKDIVSKKEGFIADKVEWKRTIKELVILDFFQENIKNHFENPTEFKKTLDRHWTKEDFTTWQKLINFIKDLLRQFALYNKKDKRKLENLGLSIADEVLSKNYNYFKYDKVEDQIRKYYKDTIASDPFAKELVESAQEMGLVLTGSLALRRAGTVYRTILETLHDVDFVVPFELSNTSENEKILFDIVRHQGPDSKFAGEIALRESQKLTWFKEFVKKHPSFVVTNGFYGKDNGYSSYTLQGVIHPERYESDGEHEHQYTYYKKDATTKQEYKYTQTQTVKHSKGDIIPNTGYAIDFFIRLNEGLDQHENYFKLWKEIMIAKLAMGRGKDFTDWKHFVPYLKSRNEFNFNHAAYRHFNYEQTGSALENSSNNVGFQDFANIVVKDGVSELFNSDPELANQVYEALGISNNLENTWINYVSKKDNISKQEVLKRLEDNNTKMITVYRGEGSTIDLENSSLPSYIKKAKGRWFTKDKGVAEQYAKMQNGKIFAIQLPEILFNNISKELNLEQTNGVEALLPQELVNEKIEINITPQQKQQALQLYSQYLDTVFPDSKVKDVVYHGTDKTFEQFSKDAEKATISDQGMFFAPTKNQARNSGKIIVKAVINSNPLISDDRIERISEKKKQELLDQGYTGYIYSYNKTISSADDIVVFEPEQIHILGNKQDIKGFKEFVNNKPVVSTNKLELDIKNLNLTPEVVNYLYQDSKAKSQGRDIDSYKKEISKIINNLQSDFTNVEILETIKCI